MGIHLTKIYTRQGDQGDTRLGDMTLVRKDHLRVIAYGEVDELNAVLGVVRLCDLPEGWDARLGSVQNDLFDVGWTIFQPLKRYKDGLTRKTNGAFCLCFAYLVSFFRP